MPERLILAHVLPPVPFPVVITEQRTVSRQALIHWRGDRYSVPPELAMATVSVHQHLGTNHIEITTASGTADLKHAEQPVAAPRSLRPGPTC